MQLSVTPYPAYHDIYYNLLDFSAADEIKIEMCVPHPPSPIPPQVLYSWCSHQRSTVGVPISALQLVFPSAFYSWCSHQRSTVGVPLSALHLVRLHLPIRILIKITSGIMTVFYLCWYTFNYFFPFNTNCKEL